MLEIMLKKGELPQLCRGDCRSSFVINKKDAGALAHKDVHPQFGFVLNTLGVKMEKRSEATFMGGIERAFRTMQSQLQQEIKGKKMQIIWWSECLLQRILYSIAQTVGNASTYASKTIYWYKNSQEQV